MNCDIIPKGGWHLSYFGNADLIQNKLQNFSHQEYNTIYFTDLDNIQRKIESGQDLFERNWNQFEFVSIIENDYLPPPPLSYFTSLHNLDTNP
jgi:hypothetical protein